NPMKPAERQGELALGIKPMAHYGSQRVTYRCRSKQMTERKLIRTILFIIVLFEASSSFAQTPGPTFEVASIKPTVLDVQKLEAAIRAGEAPMIGARVTPSQATYSYMSLKELIITAYDVKPTQVMGPDWLNEAGAQRFDIIAKLPDGATADQAPRMLQALLA